MKQATVFHKNKFTGFAGKGIIMVMLASAVNINAGFAQQNREHEQGAGNRGQEQRGNNRQQLPRRDQGTPGNRQQMPANTAPRVERPSNMGTRTAGQDVTPSDIRNRNDHINERLNTARRYDARPDLQNTNRPNAVRPVTARPYSPHTTVVSRPRPGYSASNPGWRYANMPGRNSVLTTLPSTYRTINYSGYNYRYNNGIFYRPYNNTYVVVAPPVGLFIPSLPVGYRRIYVNNYPYYYYNGTYYDYRNNNYLVVSPPVGAIVESLPAGYETININGETYYTVDGAQYKPVVLENGEIGYEVIKAN